MHEGGNTMKDIAKIELTYNDLKVTFEATKDVPLAYVDLLILAVKVIEEAQKLRRGKPRVKTDLVAHACMHVHVEG